jgi:hypothetical protein
VKKGCFRANNDVFGIRGWRLARPCHRDSVIALTAMGFSNGYEWYEAKGVTLSAFLKSKR